MTHHDVALVAYGEIGVKSRPVRSRMVDRLRANLAAVLDDRRVDAAVESRWSRLVARGATPGAAALVTGESLGQKSSQTGPNLAVTDAAVARPVHRPLLTWDKEDIVAEARRIGTFEDATVRAGCARIAPDHPETNAALDAVEAAEPDDLLDRARAAGAGARVLDG